jgi:phage gp37-like protein
MNPTFDQIIGGIEDGIIAALTAAVHVSVDDGYVKTITSYGGEMESQEVVEALSVLTPRLPAMFVAYGSGEDTLNPATQPAIKGEPRLFRHDCGFTVICCDNNARGEKARRRGAPGAVGIYKMMADVKAIIGGLQLDGIIGDESKILNSEPMRWAGVDHIARLKDLSAYAVHFGTWFRYAEPDRTQLGQLVQEVVITINNTFEKGESNLPGVVLR